MSVTLSITVSITTHYTASLCQALCHSLYRYSCHSLCHRLRHSTSESLSYTLSQPLLEIISVQCRGVTASTVASASVLSQVLCLYDNFSLSPSQPSSQSMSQSPLPSLRLSLFFWPYRVAMGHSSHYTAELSPSGRRPVEGSRNSRLS